MINYSFSKEDIAIDALKLRKEIKQDLGLKVGVEIEQYNKDNIPVVKLQSETELSSTTLQEIQEYFSTPSITKEEQKSATSSEAGFAGISLLGILVIILGVIGIIAKKVKWSKF